MRYLLIDDASLMALKVAKDYERDDLHSGRTAGRHNAALVRHSDGRRWIVWHSPSKEQITVKRLT